MHPLLQTDHHIIECARRIEEQRQRIFELKRRGEDITRSENLLALLIHFHAIVEMRRETLLRVAAAAQLEDTRFRRPRPNVR
jgi:hypothetical protein